MPFVQRGEYEHRDVIGGPGVVGLPRLNLGPRFLNDLCASSVCPAFADLNRLMHKTGERRLPGEVEFKRPLFGRKRANRSTRMLRQVLHVFSKGGGLPQSLRLTVLTDKLAGSVRRNIAVRHKGHWHRDDGLVGALKNAAVAKQPSMADIDDRNAVLAKRTPDFRCQRGQQYVFGIAFDNDQPAREKEVGLGGVEKPAQKAVIVRLKFGHALGQRKHLMPEHHHHGVKIGPRGKLRAVRAEQNLNLLASLARRNRCGPAL